MDIIFVYLLLDQESVSNDHWLYFPDVEIIFNRSVEFKNWSRNMCPSGKTALCLDITCFEGDETWTLTSNSNDFTITDGDRVRKLTPIECERLQGFADDWTKGISDTQRWKCLGNAVTTDVVEYIVGHWNEESEEK